MTKLETTGDFMLIDPVTREVIEAEGATAVKKITGFMQERIDSGQLRIVEDKKVEAPKAEVAETPFAAEAKTRSKRAK